MGPSSSLIQVLKDFENEATKSFDLLPDRVEIYSGGEKVTKIIAIKNIKNTKTTLLNLMIFMLKRKMFLKNMINKSQIKVNVLTVVNLVILVKIAIKNLVS